jgi:polysaccharide deacetylase family protein (PEP-CTERM system associated)
MATLNALTFDIEDYFHVSAFQSSVPKAEWDRYESRVERNTAKLLELLAASGVRATFFVLGWVAERFPQLVKAIHGDGHEVSCHGYSHEMLSQLNPGTFRDDIHRAKGLLEDLIGCRVLGYRAPSFTVVQKTMWALPILVEEGFAYDSSIFPIRHDRYGMPHANPLCHRLLTSAGPLWEIPPSTVVIGGMRFPIAGGGYFRLLPYRLSRRLLKHVERQGVPLVMYLHPWELDPAQPRIQSSRLSRFRHYVNLDKTEKRLTQLLQDFRFGPICEVIEPISQVSKRKAFSLESSEGKEPNALVRG